MKVKSIFQSVVPSSSYNRHGGRRAIRRGNNEFHRLESSDIPNVHFNRNIYRTSRDGTSQLIPENDLQIELENLQGAATSSGASNQISGGYKKGNNNNPGEDDLSTSRFNNRLQFDDDFKVYNPTSEELPQDDSENALHLALSDVRLKFREAISAGESGCGDDDSPRAFLGRERSTGISFRQCICGWGKAYLFLIFATLLALLCTAAVTILFFRANSSNAKTSTDLEILSTREWPLHDFESRNMNISFNPHKREQQLWDFEKDLEGDDENNATSKHSNDSEQINHKLTPGILTLNGHLVDRSITEEIFHFAKEILQAKIHENSTHLENISWKGVATNFVLNELKLKLNLTPNSEYLEGHLENDICDKDVEFNCSGTNKISGYRSANGSCNNLVYTMRGSLYAPFRRISISSNTHGRPRLSESFIEHLTGGNPEIDPDASTLLPLWGLFISHDTVKTANSPVPCDDGQAYHDHNTNAKHKSDGANMEFCSLILSSNNRATTNFSHFPENANCSHVSQCPATYPSCKIGPRTSFNLVTSYIDASNIYGSVPERMSKLREKRGGKMKVTHVLHSQVKGFLPLASELNETCHKISDELSDHNQNCFISGDDDINQMGVLTALNTLFVRQHNWIASWLHRTNLHWNDERLFQESRRILIAQIQHITYNEFLPQILGNHLMNFSGLNLKTDGFYDLYDPEVDSSVSEVFAGAVRYFIYSMSDGKLQSIWKTGKTPLKIRYDIGAQILRPNFLMEGKGHLEAIVRGLAFLAANRVGLEFSAKMRSVHLKYSNKTINLVKLALEEGRKLEIASYVEWRKTCGFSEIKSFEDLKRHWHDHAYLSITSVYKHVEEIDLFTGMLAEIPIPSGKVGPTLGCLLIDQFLRFKQGDRFWYEGDIYFHHFSTSQLKSIRETTLARIICDTTDRNFDQIQKWAMLLPSHESNPILPCSDIERIRPINFHLWKERPYKLLQTDDDDDSDDWDFDPLHSMESATNTKNEIFSDNHTTISSSTFRSNLSAIELLATGNNHVHHSSEQNVKGEHRSSTFATHEIANNQTRRQARDLEFSHSSNSRRDYLSSWMH